jgi:hypothetical protein
MGGKSGQTIGFHYLLDILFGLGRGPWNDLRAIKVGDKIAWEGPLCDTDCQAIQSPDLFGGEQKEGGIQGPFRMFWGSTDQVLPGACSADCGATGPLAGSQPLPEVKSTIGGLISEMRGTTMLWFSGLVTSMNPYPKAWEFRGRRYSAGWFNDTCWYPAKSAIWLAAGTVGAMNPAHIIFQCFTDPQWGRGYDWADLDENSFIYAANTLCAEGFGLCLVWQRKDQNVNEFIDMVCDYIGAVYYTDPETGKIVLRLVRSDYVADDLPLFTPTTGLIDIVDDDSTSSDEAFSQVVGTGRDPVTNEDFAVRVYNLAARISQGAPNTQDKDYKGIPTKDLMARVLTRDLRFSAVGLKKYKVILDRRGWQLRPGMPFRIADTRRNLGNIILRAGQIEERSFKDGRLTISAMQDVYGLPATSFVAGVDSTWTPPPQAASPATAEQLVEANYRDLILRRDPSDVQALQPTDSLIGTVALSPNPAIYQYDLATRAAGETAWGTTSGSFTGAATLTTNITPLQTSFVVAAETSFGAANVNEAILVGDEQMGFVSYDAATHTVTVERGVADTIPQAHSAGAYLWTIDDDLVSDGRKYVSGETVEAAVLTRTSSDVLTVAEATVMSLDVDGRQARPYPPGNIQVDATLALTPLPNNANGHADPIITWNHRDRILQEDQLVGHTEASVGPEPGTTYNIRLYNKDTPTVVLRTVTAIAGTSWTYDSTMQTADGNPVAVWVELESERDGLTSHQKYRFLVWLRSGYGLGYGYNYGGF